MNSDLSSLLLFDTDRELPYPRSLYMRKKGIDKLYSTPMMTYDEGGRHPVERRTATLAQHGIRSPPVVFGGRALIRITEERLEGFAHFALFRVLRYVETIENRVRFFRYGPLHGLMHQVDQPLMMIDHFTEEALIRISNAGSLSRKSCLRGGVKSRLGVGRPSHEADAADGNPQAIHISQVVISFAFDVRLEEARYPSRQTQLRLPL